MNKRMICAAIAIAASWMAADPDNLASQQNRNRNQQNSTARSGRALQQARDYGTPSLSPVKRSDQSSRSSQSSQRIQNAAIEQLRNSGRAISMIPSSANQAANNRGQMVWQRSLPSFAGSNESNAKQTAIYRGQNQNRRDVVIQRPDTVFHRSTINRGGAPIDRPNPRPTIINSGPTINTGNSQVNNNTTVNQRIVNRTVNRTTINNNTINQNSNNRIVNNNQGYGSHSIRPYYSKLHYHWQPTCWAQNYRPAFYNYTVSGVGVFGLGNLGVSYVNPFFVKTNVAYAHGYDYSRPIALPYPNYRETAYDLAQSERAIRRFDDARGVFRRGEYGRANELIDEAIALLPNDPTLHQFRALTLFARQRFSEASGVMYSVLAVSPGWDADTISRLYENPQTYLAQVANLENYVRDKPQATDSQFLLAYHRVIIGDAAGALQLLQNVRAVYPNDTIVRNLSSYLGGP
jgi:hypothetical protein